MDTPPLDISGLEGRAGALRQQAQSVTPREQLLSHALEELETSMEELRVAEEELRVQNEALEEMRDGLEQQAQRYQDLFDHAPDAYLVTDEQAVIREANRAAEALLQTGARALIGRPLLQFVAGEERARFRSEILPTAASGAAASEHFLRLQTRRGEFPVALAVTAAGGGAAPPGGLRWLLRDATASGQAEEERFRLLVQEMADYAVILMDDAGRVLTWNQGAERTFGHAPTEIIGRDTAPLFVPEDRAQGADVRERETARATGRAEDERWHLKADGSRFWGSGVLTRLDGGGTRARFVKIVRDMTARKQAEERMRSDYAREHRIAQTLQSALLPRFAEDAFPGWGAAAFYEPAWEEASVGGDFYDIIPLRGGLIAFVVGDVAGKGLNAATRTGEIKASLRAFLREDPDPASALTRLNRLTCDAEQLDRVEEHLLLVAAVAVADTRAGDIRFASAGLEPPILVRAPGVMEVISAQGLTLGVMRDAVYENVRRHLEVGDLLIMATDGLTEARHQQHFLGHDGLMTVIGQALPQHSPAALGEAVLAEVRRFTTGGPAQSGLKDDACLLIARRLATPGQDAGSPDAGSPDAGSPDAGSPDAETSEEPR